ncbi:macrolide family glycosyltransferase [Actinomadura sp. NPDC000929]|uniref:macrolide family glycosyltransferase n=1 Tax=Actinomadura sp. NPDC000929 TaxID=3154517 RepID=UPI00339A3857
MRPHHILFAVTGGSGHIRPTYGVLDELSARGHRLSFVTSGDYAEDLAEVGARQIRHRSIFEDGVDLPEIVEQEDAEALTVSAFVNENLAMLRAAESALDDDPPDLVVYDIFPLIAGRLLAARWQRPAVCINGGFASNEHYSVWEALSAVHGHRPIVETETFQRMMSELLPEYRIDRSPTEFWNAIEDLNVIFLPRSFQVKSDTFDDRFVFVGPSFSQGRLRPGWRPPREDANVLLVSLGSTFNGHPEFFRSCAQAFAGTPWHVVLVTGDGTDPKALEPLPPNVEVHQYISFMEVLRHAKAFILQGTLGATMEAVHWGCPMLFFTEYAVEARPFAERSVELGLGHVLRPEQVDGGGLVPAVEKLVADDGVRRRIARMRAEARDAGGAARAAEAIDSYARRAGTRSGGAFGAVR